MVLVYSPFKSILRFDLVIKLTIYLMLSNYYHWYSITICRCVNMYKFLVPPIPSIYALLGGQGLPELLPLGLSGVDCVTGVLRHQLTLAPHLRPLQTRARPRVLSTRGASESSNPSDICMIRSSGRTDTSISKAPVGVGEESKKYRTIPRRRGRYFSVMDDSFQEISEKAIKSLR